MDGKGRPGALTIPCIPTMKGLNLLPYTRDDCAAYAKERSTRWPSTSRSAGTTRERVVSLGLPAGSAFEHALMDIAVYLGTVTERLCRRR